MWEGGIHLTYRPLPSSNSFASRISSLPLNPYLREPSLEKKATESWGQESSLMSIQRGKDVSTWMERPIENHKVKAMWTSLVAQWLGIHLPIQGSQVRSLLWENPHALRKLSPWATATESALGTVLCKRSAGMQKPDHHN